MAVWCDSTDLNRATVVYILLTEAFESSQVVNLAVCIFWMCRHGVNLIDVNLKNSRRLPFSKVVVCDKKPSWLPVLICIPAAFVAGSTAVETRQVVRVRILSKQHLQSVLLIRKTHTHTHTCKKRHFALPWTHHTVLIQHQSALWFFSWFLFKMNQNTPAEVCKSYFCFGLIFF